MFLCNAEPTTFAEASSTYKMGVATNPAGPTLFGPPSAGSPSGRKVTSLTALGTFTADGTASWWAACSTTSLLARAPMLEPAACAIGQGWAVNGVSVAIP
ncbi:hypothetical protein LMTR3_14135 [Bradyrhizobium sp. LMTR 3]|nr:hypothetical protein LMTR3_14135 [Bradyrhizobium sp. LMTR 3]